MRSHFTRTAIGAAVIGTVSLASPALAATLRGVVQIQGPMVHLSDLFAGLDAGQDCVLGDAPAPGARLVLQQPQLEAISSQFAVSWVPSGADQTVIIARAGRPIEDATVMSMLQDLIRQQLGTRKFVVTHLAFDGAMIDQDAGLAIIGLSIGPDRDVFHASLIASIGGRETSRLPVSGRIETMFSVVVPARSIAEGDILAEQDLSMMDVPAGRIRGEVVEHIDDVVGLLAVRALRPGMPMTKADLRRPDLVHRGGPVMVRLSLAGIDVAAQGQALESGALDERIRVLNPLSHAILIATITGQNEVRLEPGSAPYLPTRFGYGASNPLARMSDRTLEGSLSGLTTEGSEQ